MRRMGWYRKIVVVVRKLEHLAQIKLGVVAQTCTGVSGGMFALGDAEFTAVEPIRFLTRSVGQGAEAALASVLAKARPIHPCTGTRPC